MYVSPVPAIAGHYLPLIKAPLNNGGLWGGGGGAGLNILAAVNTQTRWGASGHTHTSPPIASFLPVKGEAIGWRNGP